MEIGEKKEISFTSNGNKITKNVIVESITDREGFIYRTLGPVEKSENREFNQFVIYDSLGYEITHKAYLKQNAKFDGHGNLISVSSEDQFRILCEYKDELLKTCKFGNRFLYIFNYDAENRITEYTVETKVGKLVEKKVHRFEYLKWTEKEKSSEERIFRKINSGELVLREKMIRGVINDRIFTQNLFDASDNEIFSEVLEMTNDSTYRETKSKTVVKTEKYEPNHNCVIEKNINGYFYQQETIISDDERIELITTTKTNVDGSREDTEYMNIMNEEKNFLCKIL